MKYFTQQNTHFTFTQSEIDNMNKEFLKEFKISKDLNPSYPIEQLEKDVAEKILNNSLSSIHPLRRRSWNR